MGRSFIMLGLRLGVALTGSCALLYLLYRFKKTSGMKPHDKSGGCEKSHKSNVSNDMSRKTNISRCYEVSQESCRETSHFYNENLEKSSIENAKSEEISAELAEEDIVNSENCSKLELSPKNMEVSEEYFQNEDQSSLQNCSLEVNVGSLSSDSLSLEMTSKRDAELSFVEIVETDISKLCSSNGNATELLDSYGSPKSLKDDHELMMSKSPREECESKNYVMLKEDFPNFICDSEAELKAAGKVETKVSDTCSNSSLTEINDTSIIVPNCSRNLETTHADTGSLEMIDVDTGSLLKVDENAKEMISNKGRSKRQKRKERRKNQQNEEDNSPKLNNGVDSTKQEVDSAPELTCTSDLEREATPEQENAASDCQSSVSQGSFDSGQGSIEVDADTIFPYNVLYSNDSHDQYIFYHFEIPQTLVGRLIGKKGTVITRIKLASSTKIHILDHSRRDLKLCSIEGKRSDVIRSLEMVRELFPLDQYSEVTLEQVNSLPRPPSVRQPQMNRDILQVELPPGVVAEVQASAIVSTGELWLQQPLHPTYSALQQLHQCMNLNYDDGASSPIVPLPIQPSTICVCQIGGQWLRCQVSDHDNVSCTVTLLDIGGVLTVPIDLLRQIRVDYVGLPFQASHCFLHGIQPVNDNGWMEEGRQVLEDLIKNCIVSATIAAYTQDGVPLVNLYKRNFNQYTFINEKLVVYGHAKWVSASDIES